MGGRVCALQGAPFQAWALSASPAQASATLSLELCLMSPSHQSSDSAWGAPLRIDISPGVALPNAHSEPPGPGGPWAAVFWLRQKGPWSGRQPNFLVTHSQTPPQPAPLALETRPNLTATSSSLTASPAWPHLFLQRGTLHPACPPPLRQREQQELRVWGRRNYVCRTESSLCVWNTD